MAANYKQVVQSFRGKSQSIQDYFMSFPELVEKYPWAVSVSYVFSYIEAAKHDTIYCGIVKLHWTDAALTREAVDRSYMGRKEFKQLFHTVFNKNVRQDLLEKLERAEAVRDKVVHGKRWTQDQIRQALVDIFDFAEEFNAFVFEAAGFRPFGNRQGFKGRRESLSKQTTKWVLRGMGIGTKDPG